MNIGLCILYFGLIYIFLYNLFFTREGMNNNCSKIKNKLLNQKKEINSLKYKLNELDLYSKQLESQVSSQSKSIIDNKNKIKPNSQGLKEKLR